MARRLLAEYLEEAIASVKTFHHKRSSSLEFGNEINLQPYVLLHRIQIKEEYDIGYLSDGLELQQFLRIVGPNSIVKRVTSLAVLRGLSQNSR